MCPSITGSLILASYQHSSSFTHQLWYFVWFLVWAMDLGFCSLTGFFLLGCQTGALHGTYEHTVICLFEIDKYLVGVDVEVPILLEQLSLELSHLWSRPSTLRWLFYEGLIYFPGFCWILCKSNKSIRCFCNYCWYALYYFPLFWTLDRLRFYVILAGLFFLLYLLEYCLFYVIFVQQHTRYYCVWKY